MSKEIKAAGYIRVSSIAQTDNESLPNQEEFIEQHCKDNDYKLTKIYADEGISGSTVEGRPGVIQALQDAQRGKYDVLIVWDITRFGRNLKDVLENYEILKDSGVKLYSKKEGGDFDNPEGKLKLSTMGMIAEYESNKIRDRMMGGKLSKIKRGVPVGPLPFGRTFDYEEEEWGLEPKIRQRMQWVANQFLSGKKSMKEISQVLQDRWDLPATYSHLLKVLKEDCGTHWENNFEALDKPKIFKVPRLLPDDTIQKIKDRLAHNRKNNRTDTKDYLLSGFVMCMDCHKHLTPQTQNEKYEYYRHRGGDRRNCDASFNSVPAGKLEDAVFKTIFENLHDVPTFEEAIKGSLPTVEHIKKLKQTIQEGKKDLKKIDSDIKKLVEAVLDGTLDKEDIKEKRKSLEKTKEQTEEEVSKAQHQLDNLPNREEALKEAHRIRTRLKRKYQSEEHLQNMSFKDKKQLLHFLFDGKAPKGDEYGIYVDKRGRGKTAEIDYFMFGKITGLRTIKGDDIDYTDHLDRLPEPKSSLSPDELKARKKAWAKKRQGWDNLSPAESYARAWSKNYKVIEETEDRITVEFIVDDEDSYVVEWELDDNGVPIRDTKRRPKYDSSHKNSDYNTNNFSFMKKRNPKNDRLNK